MSETTTELAEIVPDVLVNVQTGETLPATIESVPVALEAARAMKLRLDGVIEAATAVVLEESRIRGTKTFHIGDVDVVLSGGPGVEYDPAALADCLRDAGCPEDRIDEVVKAEVTFKVDRAVLRQLTGANEDYRAAAELAERPTSKPWRAYPRPRR